MFCNLSAKDKMHILQNKQSLNTIAMVVDGVDDSPVMQGTSDNNDAPDKSEPGIPEGAVAFSLSDLTGQL